MIFAKDLLLKGAAGLALCAGVGAGGWYVITQNNKETLKSLADKVGLNCGDGTPGDSGFQCTKINEEVNIKVKQGDSANDKFEVSNITGGSIKVYEAKSSEGYNGDFKFVIEGGDITVTENNKKLEQFETYEIKKDNSDKKLYLTKKTDAKDGIKKALGLPDDCQFPTATDQEGCDIAGDKFKKIKFDGIDNSANGPAGAKLKITSETNKQEFPLGFKFVLVSTTNTTISNSLTIKANTNTEFKIKNNNNNAITLEKAWSLENLAAKVGLESCNATSKECSLKANSVNVHNGEDKKYINTNKSSSAEDKKVKYEENVEGFNQGFKFYAEEEITLENGTQVNSTGSEDTTNKKIEQKGSGSTNVFYEVKKGTGGDANWYLTKKSVTVAA